MNKGTIFIKALLQTEGLGNKRIFDYIVSNKINYNKCYENIETLISREQFNRYYEIAEKEVEKNLSLGIDSICMFDENFPSKLYTVKDPVLFLYYRGNADLLKEKSIAIIGSRKASSEALEKTAKYTNEFVSKGIVIVSGLALGVDASAHTECVNLHGKTIAVMPCGLDKIEPASNKKLAAKILEEGGLLVSEYSCGTVVAKFNYAKRDRIQSALANCILVTEAAEDSGTMIAVKKNFESNKEVYQDLNNRNTLIKNKIDLNDDDINTIIETIDKDNEKENKKFDALVGYDKGEQISLF